MSSFNAAQDDRDLTLRPSATLRPDAAPRPSSGKNNNKYTFYFYRVLLRLSKVLNNLLQGDKHTRGVIPHDRDLPWKQQA